MCNRARQIELHKYCKVCAPAHAGTIHSAGDIAHAVPLFRVALIRRGSSTATVAEATVEAAPAQGQMN